LKAWSGHAEIHYVCLAKERKDYEDIEKYGHLFKEVKVFWQPKWLSLVFCLWGLLTGTSLQVSYCRNTKLTGYLRNLDLDSFDTIYIKRLRMAQYANQLPADKVWIDLTDSMGLYYARMLRIKVPIADRAIARYERKFLGDFETRMMRTHKTIFCSKVDLFHASKNIEGKCHAVIIPNVVDLDEFPYTRGKGSSPIFRMCYWGNLSVPMNFTAVEILLRDVLPRILEKLPDCQLEVIGPNPPKHLLRMSSRSVMFTGHVEHLNLKLCKMDLFVCPLIFGTGVKNKVLQSFALGLPVLTTTIGAEGIEGIEELVNKGMLFIENNISAYPALILALNKNLPFGQNRMRDFVSANYSIASLRDSLVDHNLI